MNRATPIDLLRHGETEGGARYWGSTDVSLSSAGWNQMWAAVKHGQWDAIHSSPLQRCANFARALSEHLNLPLTLDDRLREIDFGIWEGKTSLELMDSEPEALLRFWEDPWQDGPPGGEPMDLLQRRVLDAWSEIVARPQRALIISHGGPLRIILAHTHGWPRTQLLNIETPHATLLRVDVNQSASDTKEAATP